MAALDRRWRAVLTVLLAIYGYFCLRNPGEYRWLDSLDLAIHETGHLVFMVGGETLTILGGTLFQIIVPAALGGGEHHWATLLERWGLMTRDGAIADAVLAP